MYHGNGNSERSKLYNDALRWTNAKDLGVTFKALLMTSCILQSV